MRTRLYALGLFAATISVGGKPAYAKMEEPLSGLTLRTGEIWIFKIVNGQPLGARRAGEKDEPVSGELKVSLNASMGTTMEVVNNDKISYNYHAYVTSDPSKKGSPTSVCTLMGGGRMAFENWPNRIEFIRIADFVPAVEGKMDCR